MMSFWEGFEKLYFYSSLSSGNDCGCCQHLLYMLYKNITRGHSRGLDEIEQEIEMYF